MFLKLGNLFLEASTYYSHTYKSNNYCVISHMKAVFQFITRNDTTFIKCLLCARHYAKRFMYVPLVIMNNEMVIITFIFLL